MMIKAKVLQKGQVVIPASIRKKYGIRPGTVIEIVDAGDRILLRPAPRDPVTEAMGMLKGRVSVTGELLRARQEEKTSEERKYGKSSLRKSKGE